VPTNLVTVIYLVCGILFILSLGGLGKQETARTGNHFGIIGMSLAMVATALSEQITEYPVLGGCVLLGGIVGAVLAAGVEMTSMPQLVAMLHSFVGLAAVLVGYASYLGESSLSGADALIHDAEVFVGVFIGALTFTGSLAAFGKLQGWLDGKPLLLPGRHAFNAVIALACICLGGAFLTQAPDAALLAFAIMTGLSALLGAHLVLAIGGADMPVVVSMLNSYSGWAAAATGFMLSNDLLIITGALVGSSGAILSYIMCKAMNRSLTNVIFGGFGAAPTGAPSTAAPVGEVTATNVEETVDLLRDAKEVVIVPGYGMAVAQAQHPLREITSLLNDRGTRVRFAIHPVAGRLPGHMNVLLAEARVPYDIVLEMDEINQDLPDTDVVLVIGANDIVNPGALEDASSPIYGMPVLEVWRAHNVVVLKRGMAAGYAGVENPLFYKNNTRMLFGDAKKNVDAILLRLREGEQARAAE
jgi:H+-translocating NAD(P) transhydrogenase subunit beta